MLECRRVSLNQCTQLRVASSKPSTNFYALPNKAVLRRLPEPALGAGIAVVHDAIDVFTGAGSDPQRHLERVEGQLGRHGRGGAPADDAVAEHVVDNAVNAMPDQVAT